MHKSNQLMFVALALGLSAVVATAQDAQPRRPDNAPPREGRGPGGPGGPPDGQRPPVHPIIAALDLNNDGVIDASEIAKASQSLKKLDKNSDGKITPEEYRPARPPGGQGGFGGPGGPGGSRGGPQGEERPPRRPQAEKQ